jgi:hypothetical protein
VPSKELGGQFVTCCKSGLQTQERIDSVGIESLYAQVQVFVLS